MNLLLFFVTLCLSWLAVQAVLFGFYFSRTRKSGKPVTVRGAVEWLQSHPPLVYGLINGSSVFFVGLCSFSAFVAAYPVSGPSLVQAMSRTWRFAAIWGVLVGGSSFVYHLARLRSIREEAPDR